MYVQHAGTGTVMPVVLKEGLVFLGVPVIISGLGAQLRAHQLMKDTGFEPALTLMDMRSEWGYRLGVGYHVPEGMSSREVIAWVKASVANHPEA